MTQGIYCIEIGGHQYIGKDMEIDKEKRLRGHVRLLNKNEHYNSFMQKAFNKYQEVNYSVLIEFRDISKEDLSKCERFYIDIFDTYKDGMNLTKGGEGGLGVRISDQERRNRSERTTGEKNPLSKLTNEDFYNIVELLKNGKTNKEIAQIYNLHDRYVSLIRHKKRFKNLWATIEDYVSEKSNSQQRGLTEEQFIEVVGLLNDGWTNADIQRKYGLSAGTGSRIRHKKLYKRYWDKYFSEERIVENNEIIEA